VFVQDTENIVRRIRRDENGGHRQDDQRGGHDFDTVPHGAMIYLPGGEDVKK
jgi:hypothetical protein